MKKLFALVAILFASATLAHAQFGLVGGVSISGTNLDTHNIWNNAKSVTLYHVGVAYQFDMSWGFSFQPSLTYEMKGTNLSSAYTASDIASIGKSLNARSGYLELGAGLQWGPDLLIARPFVVLTPYLGYQIVSADKSVVDASLGPISGSTDSKTYTEAKNKLEYGFGIGAGVELLKHLQLSVQYFMNLGPLYSNGTISAPDWEMVKDIHNYNGVKVTLGFFF